MKMIYVYGDGDFAAVEFENYFTGKSVNEIIERFFINLEEHDGDFIMKLYNFDEIDSNFIEFVRNKVQDYDFAKAQNFYFEGETIN